ncbi:THAP domain [Popillia japonica]|uniref:THAP domain n=1 Tax=Popillia japonica TaxID=7064 RepID=A0AAW1K3B1_POPJA
MPGCAVNACGNYNRATKGSNIRYYRFPKDKALAKQWIAAYQGFYIDGKSLFITKDSIQKLLEVANSELTICPKINSSHLELTGPQRQRVQKLVRNHFLDQGFYIDGKSITKDSIQKLLEVANSELTICPKINSSHLELTGPQRQRVRPAAQLLSHSRTVAKALEYCGTNNMLPATNWRDTSNFILMINDWFDVHNSTSKFCGNNPTKNAFGIDLDNQEKILDNISSTMEQMIVGKHKSLISFQKGIILSNRSLKELYKHCNKEYGVEYLLTRRLNQDVFDEQCLLSSLETVDAEDGAECGNDTCLTESLMQNLSLRFVIIEDIDEEPAEEFCFIEPEYPVLALPENTNIANLGTLTQFEAQQKIDDEALIYIAGYVAFKFKHKYNLGEPWKNLTIP